jgi:hypothetical protein
MPKPNENILAICPQCGETVNIKNRHDCPKDRRKSLHDSMLEVDIQEESDRRNKRW